MHIKLLWRVALCLGWVGYNAEAPSTTTATTAAGIMKLSIILPLVGYALIFAALFFLYNLSKEKVEENGAILRAKRVMEIEAIPEEVVVEEDAEVITVEEVAPAEIATESAE